MIVIDPNGGVRRVKYTGDIEQITKELHCELFDIVRIRLGDISFDIFVDDEGLYRNLENGQPMWNLKTTHLRMLDWLNQKDDIAWMQARKMPPLAGYGVCLAHDDEGNTIELPDAINEFILSNLGEDVTMEYED